jgi:hypothetical protein
MQLAVDQNDVSICSLIKNSQYKEVCKIAVSKDFERCEDIEHWDFSETEFTSKDLEDIKGYSEKLARAMFIPTMSATIAKCYSYSAEFEGDINICNHIEDEERRHVCKMQFPEQYAADYCSNKESTYDEESCLKDFALTTLNTSVCQEISDIEDRRTCIHGVIGASNNSQSCADAFDNETDILICLRKFPNPTDELDLCRMKTEGYPRDNCLYTWAYYNSLNLTICEEITNQEISYACMAQVIMKSDTLSCDEIPDSFNRETCVRGKVARLSNASVASAKY